MSTEQERKAATDAFAEECVTPDWEVLKELGRDLLYEVRRGLFDRLGLTEIGQTAQRLGQSSPNHDGSFQLRHDDKERPDRRKFERDVGLSMRSQFPCLFIGPNATEIKFSYGNGADETSTANALARRGEYAMSDRAELGIKPRTPAKTIARVKRRSDPLGRDAVRAAIANLTIRAPK